MAAGGSFAGNAGALACKVAKAASVRQTTPHHAGGTGVAGEGACVPGQTTPHHAGGTGVAGEGACVPGPNLPHITPEEPALQARAPAFPAKLPHITPEEPALQVRAPAFPAKLPHITPEEPALQARAPAFPAKPTSHHAGGTGVAGEGACVPGIRFCILTRYTKIILNGRKFPLKKCEAEMYLTMIVVRSVSVTFIWLSILGAARYVPAQTPCSGKDALTARTCPGDAVSPDEKELFDLVTKYRAANGLPVVRLSSSLSMVANRHIIDLVQNVKSFTHGWSNCPYDINVEKTWPCVSDSPKRLNSGYTGQAFETLYRTTTGKATPDKALEAWKKSRLHNSIILNLETFKDMQWDEVGVGIGDGYAVLWFGSSGNTSGTISRPGKGIGVSYDQALGGLSKLLSTQTMPVGGLNKWIGVSADKKVRIEILGTLEEITWASVDIEIKSGMGGQMAAADQRVVAKLLGNLFPEWPNIDSWLTTSIAAVADDSSAWRTKTVRGIKIDLRSDGVDSLKLLIKP